MSLLHVEHGRIPKTIWEPAAGDGAIVNPLSDAGHEVFGSDIRDYGAGFQLLDYLKAPVPLGIQGIITNPPYRRAAEFVEKATTEVPYLALLLRTNFLESSRRLSLFRKSPPSRVWISSRRLPMMHRYGWQGPKAPSNTCHAWFVWDATSSDRASLDWFDWHEIMQPSLVCRAVPEMRCAG